jgi:hypothetical protein
MLTPELSIPVERLLHNVKGIGHIALLSCLNRNVSVIRQSLNALSQLPNDQLEREPFQLFDLSDLDWTGADTIFLDLLGRKIPALGKSLTGGACPVTVQGLPKLSSADIQNIFSWMVEIKSDRNGWWLRRQIGSIIGRYGDESVRSQMLSYLGDGEARVRRSVKDYVLPYLRDVSSDDLSERALSYLLSELYHPGSVQEHWNNPLGEIATERFVTEQLLPLARGQPDAFLDNLRVVLKVAGDRHGCRYMLPA